MALIVPKQYMRVRDQIISADDFRQISVLLWADSAPDDFIDRIEQLGYPALVSPLHDKDIYLDDEDGHEKGTPKKAHYHVDFLFKGRKNAEQCQHIADVISGQDNYSWYFVVERYVHARYLCHLDSRKKHRYPVSDLISINGANISKLIGDSEEQEFTDEILNDILDWVTNTQCCYFNQLVDYARYNQKNEWIKRLRRDLTPFIKAYMQGLNLQLERSKKLQAKYANNL